MPEFVAQIVSAHCSSNTVAAETLPALIHTVHAALTQTGEPEQPVLEKPVLAVHPKKSVFLDYIVCLEDGKKLKMLKRHLQSTYGMTPQQYRERWGMPSDYPMTAPSYAERRSKLARDIGLGRKPNADAKLEAVGVPPGQGRHFA